MAKDATVISILVASPSDVTEERECLEEVVSNINLAFAASKIRLELIRWERNASPAFGKDPQTVLNEQIPSDYDVFLGIMWNTVGSPTGRADSGTIEEFEKAKERFDQDSSSVQMMWYFKDALPSSMEDIVPEQLEKVREFRARIQRLGLYQVFSSADDFAMRVQVHLSKLVASRLQRHHEKVPPDKSKAQIACVGDVQEGLVDVDEGLIDVQETYEAEMSALTSVLERIGEATVEIGDVLKRRKKDVDVLTAKLRASREPRSLRGEVKRLLAQASRDLDRYVSKMQRELPLYRQHLDRGMHAYARTVPLSLRIDADSDELEASALGLIQSMGSLMTSIGDFKSAFRDLPPLSTALNRSKRATEGILQEVIDITRDGKATLHGVLRHFD